MHVQDDEYCVQDAQDDDDDPEYDVDSGHPVFSHDDQFPPRRVFVIGRNLFYGNQRYLETLGGIDEKSLTNVTVKSQ